jgi:hypothetical protein
MSCWWCIWHTSPACLVQDSNLHCFCFVLHNEKHETSYHVIISDCPFDHFIMLYQLLKKCSTTGINQDVSVYFTVQSWCLFQWLVVNHRDRLSCTAAWTWINLIYYRNENTYSVCPWNTETEWIGSRKSHRRKVVSRDDVTTRRWVGWDEVWVSSWSWPVWRIEVVTYLQFPQWIAYGSPEHRALTQPQTILVMQLAYRAVQYYAISTVYIAIMVLAVIPCTLFDRYQHFRVTCCLHLQGIQR